jgi:hypothetical protein
MSLRRTEFRPLHAVVDLTSRGPGLTDPLLPPPEDLGPEM